MSEHINCSHNSRLCYIIQRQLVFWADSLLGCFKMNLHSEEHMMLYMNIIAIGVPVYTVCSFLHMHSKCNTVFLTSGSKTWRTFSKAILSTSGHLYGLMEYSMPGCSISTILEALCVTHMHVFHSCIEQSLHLLHYAKSNPIPGHRFMNCSTEHF